MYPRVQKHLLRGGLVLRAARILERTRILITAFALTVLWAGAAWGQGPVIIMGIDGED